jgi:PTH1 family peptidyl-tRNA hydrolase
VIALFAEEQKIPLKKSNAFFFGAAQVDHHAVRVAIPNTYMNESGRAISALLDVHHFEPNDLVVVHDDMYVSAGQLRFKKGGRDGGHKGVRSVIGAMGTDGFWRLKLGIGRPSTPGDDVGYVLEKIPDHERRDLAEMIERAVQAIVCFAVQGPDAAMNRYHQRPSGPGADSPT